MLDPAEPGGARMSLGVRLQPRGRCARSQSSLDRLGLDRVDILFIHDPDDHYEQASRIPFPCCSSCKRRAG